MNLVVSNIGKVASANIKLDGLTAIIGNNDMGKSTVGKVLYSVLRAMTGMPEGIFDARVNYVIEASKLRKHPALRRIFRPADFVPNATLSVEEIKERLSRSSYFGRFYPYASLRERAETKEFDVLAKRLLDEIAKARSIDEAVLEHDVISNNLANYFNDQFLPNYRDFVEPSSVELEALGCVVRADWNSERKPELLKSIPMLEGWFVGSPYILDAVGRVPRIGHLMSLDQVHQDLVWRLRRSSNGDMIAKRVVQGELMPVMRLFERPISAAFSTCGDDTLGVQFPQMKDPLHVGNLSMGLKTFTVLRLMLESNVLNRGDVLILDEPENHLHPAYQVLFAQIIVLLQRIYQLCILVTTHSPYFLQALELYSRREGEDSDRGSPRLNVYRPRRIDGLGRVKFDDITGNTSEMYRKFAAALRELDQLRSEIDSEEMENNHD